MQNKILRNLLILLLTTFTISSYGVEMVNLPSLTQDEWLLELDHHLEQDNLQLVKPKFRKLKAVLLALFLGHFGVHRIYLGTSPNVPVVYSLTLGGGLGILPLLDIIAILSTKDLEQFAGNEQVFMWSKKKVAS